MNLILGDIGGTKTRLIWCSSEKDLKDSKKLKIFATPKSYKEFLELLKNFVNSTHPRQSVSIPRASAVIFGFAGMFDKKKEKLIYSPNLNDFKNRNLKKDLERILKCEIILENDAVLAGLGEGNFGAGKKLKSFGYITLSTGVGGAKIIKIPMNYPNDDRMNYTNNKRITLNNNLITDSDIIRANNLDNVRADFNLFGFEPGHSFLLMNDFLFEFEELLGGESIRKIYGQELAKIKNKKFWNYYHHILLIFLINVSIFWSVDKIILGGGITKNLDFKKLNILVNKFHPLPIKIKIIKAKLGELSVLYGGYVIANG